MPEDKICEQLKQASKLLEFWYNYGCELSCCDDIVDEMEESLQLSKDLKETISK